MDHRDSNLLDNQIPHQDLHMNGVTDHQSFHIGTSEIEETIPLYSTFYKINPINGIGYISTNNLIKEIQKIKHLTTPLKIKIALGVVKSEMTLDLSQENDIKFKSVVPVREARKCIKLLLQHQNGPPGLKRFGDKSGIAVLTWATGNLQTPYIKIEGILFIPISFAEKMHIKNMELVAPIFLNTSKKAHLLMEMANMSPQPTDMQIIHANDMAVASVETIQRASNIMIKFANAIK